MKLLSIKFCNFRQFYGQTPEIILAQDRGNTTVIHGNNGSGKTTFLNGFTWLLYEKFTAAFALPEQLINKRAIAEAELNKAVTCWVELLFEHDHKKYQLKRVCRAYKTEDKIEYRKSELYMQIAGEDGRWGYPSEQPDAIIGRILPENLHQYFFFDGERIDYIARSQNKEDIAEATKEILGVEVLNRSIRHLGEARRVLESELKTIGDPETKSFIKAKDKLEKEVEILQNRQEEIERELEHLAELKGVMSNRLLELSGAAELQKLRSQLESQGSSLKQQIHQTKEQLKRLISTRAYVVFMQDAALKYQGIVQELREKGQLPTGIKRQFLEELLEKKRCICGTELGEGTEAHTQVYHWIEKAGIADVEETTIRLISQVDQIEHQVSLFWEECDRYQGSLSQYRMELAQVENQLDDLKKKLRHCPDEDVSQLQKRLDETENKIADFNREIGSNQQQIINLRKEIEELIKKIEKQKMNEYKQNLAQRRIAVTQDAMERLTEVRSRLEKQFRLQLEKRVQAIFSQISFAPYLPRLNDKYQLNLVENTSGIEVEVPASTGENQILSLSFIGGIIDGVREWSKKNTLMGPDSSTFPIVMDSPFGSLDEIYRRQIAKTLPKLANQLLVLVTKTQWRKEVEQEMTPYIGREYVLVYNSPKLDCQEDSIVLGGITYPLVKLSPNDFEYTEILPVDYDF